MVMRVNHHASVRVNAAPETQSFGADDNLGFHVGRNGEKGRVSRH